MDTCYNKYIKKTTTVHTIGAMNMKTNVYEIVTERIISLLERGVIPWKKPWKTNGKKNVGAVNWFTGRAYNGVNQMLLGWGGEWATFKQISDAGGKVKRGEKSQIVVFFMPYEKENDEGKIEKIPVLRSYNVFEINTQCEGLASKNIQTDEEDAEDETLSTIERAEAIVSGFMNAPEISFASGRAVYQPFFDRVTVPPLKDYNTAEEYYSTLFHELLHSTGSEKRLNRKFGRKFGDEAYSKEELVAEIGATMLSATAGIEQVTIENSASYIQGWLKALKDDKRLIVTAAGAAQKAADYILGTKAKSEELNKAS